MLCSAINWRNRHYCLRESFRYGFLFIYRFIIICRFPPKVVTRWKKDVLTVDVWLFLLHNTLIDCMRLWKTAIHFSELSHNVRKFKGSLKSTDGTLESQIRVWRTWLINHDDCSNFENEENVFFFFAEWIRKLESGILNVLNKN